MRSVRWHSRLLAALEPELSQPRALTEQELRSLLLGHEEAAQLPASSTRDQRIQVLLKHRVLERMELESLRVEDAEHPYPAKTRYVTPRASAYIVARSLHPRGYFSHTSAAVLHHALVAETRTIYLNREQSDKPAGGGLSQEALDRAFARPPRTTAYGYAFHDHRIYLLNGKYTNRLGVIDIVGPDTLEHPTTTLERMLIDVTVRPHYGGGLAQVLAIYAALRARISVDVLLNTLAGLRYVYPYHQAIGFLMTRTGYPENFLAALSTLGLRYNFHLVHGATTSRYDEAWRISYPAEVDHLLPPRTA